MSEQNLDPTLPESEYNTYSALLHEMQNFLSDETTEKADFAAENQLDKEITFSKSNESIVASTNSTIIEQIPLVKADFANGDSKALTNIAADSSANITQAFLENSVQNPIYNLDVENLVSTVDFSGEDVGENQNLNQAIVGEMIYSEEFSADLEDFANFNSLPLLLMAEEKETPLPDLVLEANIEDELKLDTNRFQAPQSSAPNVSSEIVLKQSETTVATPQKNTKSIAIPLDLHERYIVFRLDNEFYAFSAANIAEIGHPLPTTLLPFVPAWFLGIANLRGDILSIIGLREFWNKKSVVQQKAKMLILRSHKINLTIGVIVDAVREMRRVPTEKIQLIEDNPNDQINLCKIGTADYDGQTLHLLDAEQLLASLKV